MTDKEKMEYAAKAAGAIWIPHFHCFTLNAKRWDPCTDDGDSFRLMVKLSLNVFHVHATSYAMESEGDLTDEHYMRHANDPTAATREVIFRVAVAIGEAMP